MTDQRATTGSDTVPEKACVEKLMASLRGQLIQPGGNDYEDARKVWNGMIDRRPALIARCAGVADVIDAVNFARTNSLLVAVRGGGHSAAGNSVCDGGIVIDLSPMKGIHVDPMMRTARAEGGVTWGDFDRETQAFGLATTGGLVSTTGVAGLTLGGGIGWLMGKHGLAIDNLLSVDMVTADGAFLTASSTENTDLFWGARGGGGNFGVVTSFEYQLHHVGQLLAGVLIYPLDKAKEVLRLFGEFTSTAPDELGTAAGLATSPDGTPSAVIVAVYNEPIEEGERVLRPLREFGPPVADHVGPMAYTEVQSMLDNGAPPGLQSYWKSNFLKSLSDEAIDVLIDHFASVPSPQSQVLIERFGGAVSRVGKEETAFNHRDAGYNLVIVGMWSGPAKNESNIQWVRDLWDAMQPFSSGGVYVNYLGPEAEEGADRTKAAYGPAKYERLVALKNRYDPTNLFRLNQNIRPTV